MIQVSVKKNDGNIVSMVVTGHAESGPYGQDLVCAGVSSVITGLANALDQLHCKTTVEVKENTFSFIVSGKDKKTQGVMQVGIIQLETIAESYGDFIKIITEVK